jgi:2-polyprenyl-3-methyl-5-hydroxy-6-metoxy-1,4-benzoquinol methylase
MKLNQCPACLGKTLNMLEEIDVVRQHSRYAPNDIQMQTNLTEALSGVTVAYRMLECKGCALQFSSPLRSPPASWYQLAYEALNLYPPSRWEFNYVLSRLREADRVVEFGCGSGAFLEQCRARGIDASGMDFSVDAVECCRAKGLNVAQMDLNEAHCLPLNQPPTQVLAFHVLEHLDEPHRFFRQVATYAAEFTNLWVAVPSDRRPSRRFGREDFLDQPPHHMTRWTSEAFVAIGSRTGWRLTELIYEPISLRTAIWCISVASDWYIAEKNAGRLHQRARERVARAVLLPLALVQRLTTQRTMSGFSMLARFNLKSRQV